MTDHLPPVEPDPQAEASAVTVELERLDERARAAARGLHTHVHRRLDVDAAAASLPPTVTRRRSSRPHARFLAVAAAIAVVAGLVAVSAGRDDDGRDRVDADLTTPDLAPGLLRPLGPRDGKDSVKLPVTAVPDVGLHDGDEVTVSASGFVPGESVGLVQCAAEAGGPTPEARGGVDGCYIGQYTNLTADDQGTATGTYRVHRILTTPLTGTVDCAAQADRCMVAMGAIADYDRSGGHPIEFATDVAQAVLPTAAVVPSEELADGQSVHVMADGLTADEVVSIEICSSDPLACWGTGQSIQVDGEDGGGESLGLRSDGDGRLEGDLLVWRFLPGGEPGTYVDCAVSRCSLRLSGSVAPAPVPLHFRGDEPAPTAPSFGADRTTGLAPGDEVVLAGAGFAPGARLLISICAVSVAEAQAGFDGYQGCSGSMREPIVVDDAGSFASSFEIPDPGATPYQESCGDDGSCTTTVGGEPIRCDGVTTRCVLQVDEGDPRGRAGTDIGPPIFPAVPIPITFR